MAGPGRYRRRERTQAEERLRYEQKTWKGMNSDYPGTEIKPDELPYVENVRFRGKFVEPRPGSKYFSATYMPGSGTIRALWVHPTSKKWVLHRGTELYVSTDINAYVWRAFSLSAALPDTYSTIRKYEDNAIIFTTSGIYHVDIENQITSKLNYECPANKMIDQGTSGDYTYRYLITFVRLVDSDGNKNIDSRDRFSPTTTLISESGSTRLRTVEARDSAEIRVANPITKSNPATVYLSSEAARTPLSLDFSFTPNASTDELTINSSSLQEVIYTGAIVTFVAVGGGVLPTPLKENTQYRVINVDDDTLQVAYTLDDALDGTQIDLTDGGSGLNNRIVVDVAENLPDDVTHYGVYRTLNINSATEEGFDPVNSEGNNPEVFSWVADVATSNNQFTDKIDDEALKAQIVAGNRLAIMRGLTPLPDGNVGHVTGGWLFVTTRGSSLLHYSSISESQKRFAGFYLADLQKHDFNEKIQQLALSRDDLLVLCDNQTKPVTLTSFYNAGQLQFIPILNHFPEGDETIGVVDWGSVADFEKSTIIAKTSDHAIRLWDGVQWGDDISADVINDVIRTMVQGSVGMYYAGSYYLWYRDDASLLYNNKCLRYDTGRNKGIGWSHVTGSFVFPPLNLGAKVIQDSRSLQRLVCLDYETNRLFWIDTFDSYTGSSLDSSETDKLTDSGLCALGLKYFYDEMDDNNRDPNLLNVFTDAENHTVDEQNNRMELMGRGIAAADSARILLDKYIHNGDFVASVRQSHQDIPNDTFTYDWEVKVANFKNVTVSGDHYNSDQDDVDELDNGFLAYVTRRPGADDENNSILNWRYKSGSTEESGSIGWTEISAPSLDAPYKLGIKRESNTINVVINDVEVSPARSTNSVWGSVTNLRASFAQEKNNELGSGSGWSGFNSFFVAGGDMPNDCLGTDGQGSDTVSSPHRIASTIRLRELTGGEESHVVRHEESHTYFRPKSESDGFHDGFEVDWVSYSDGSTTATETVTDVAHSGDVQNWKKVEGRRIQNELQTNMGLWKLVGVDTHYASQDKKSIDNGPDSTDEATYQELIAGTSNDVNYLTHWLTRPDTDLNRATGDDYGLDLTQVSSPDGNTYGVSLISLDQATDTRQYTDFSMLFWVKGASGGYVEIDGGVDLRIQFLNATTIRISGGGVTTTDVTVDDMVSDWSSLLFKKTGETLTIYQNGSTTAKGSVTVGASYGNETIDFFGSEVAWSMFDFRLYRADIITPEAFEYYHNDIVNNSGNKVLAIV